GGQHLPPCGICGRLQPPVAGNPVPVLLLYADFHHRQNATSKTLHFLCFLRKKAKRSNVFLQFHKKYPSENRSESYNSSSGDKNAKNAP
ncbi:MAG: hypothetical protein II293_01840, partial [Bacteroidaceae bacterium]|nr:hypothetical protein [Bacteroidaceae bacterium]